MDINRRSLIRAGLAALAAAALPAFQRATAAPRHITSALRKRLYPGPLRPLRHDDIRRPGPWAG